MDSFQKNLTMNFHSIAYFHIQYVYMNIFLVRFVIVDTIKGCFVIGHIQRGYVTDWIP